MKRVHFDPIVHHELTDEEWSQFLTDCETDIDQDLCIVKDVINKSIEKQQKHITKTKGKLKAADPYDTRYIHRCQQAIWSTKMRVHHFNQMIIKIDECRALYQRLLNTYTLPSHTKDETNTYSDDPDIRDIVNAEQYLLDEYYTEMHSPPINDKAVLDILAATKRFFIIQLTKAVIHRRRKFEKEEDLIIQILGNIATAAEYYKNTLN